MISHDEKISAEVQQAASRLGERGVTCRVSNGDVALEGAVATDESYSELEDAVRSIPGVKSVRNSLMVEALEAQVANEVEGVDLTPDFTAVAGTEDALEAVSEAEPYIPATDPVITTSGRNSDDVEILNGFADSSDERDVGASSVLPRGDDQLRDAVEDALRLDASTADMGIDVIVHDGTVILRGNVQSLDDAEMAESVAASVDGVAEVLEELRVEGM